MFIGDSWVKEVQSEKTLLKNEAPNWLFEVLQAI